MSRYSNSSTHQTCQNYSFTTDKSDLSSLTFIVTAPLMRLSSCCGCRCCCWRCWWVNVDIGTIFFAYNTSHTHTRITNLSPTKSYFVCRQVLCIPCCRCCGWWCWWWRVDGLDSYRRIFLESKEHQAATLQRFCDSGTVYNVMAYLLTVSQSQVLSNKLSKLVSSVCLLHCMLTGR